MRSLDCCFDRNWPFREVYIYHKLPNKACPRMWERERELPCKVLSERKRECKTIWLQAQMGYKMQNEACAPVAGSGEVWYHFARQLPAFTVHKGKQTGTQLNWAANPPNRYAQTRWYHLEKVLKGARKAANKTTYILERALARRHRRVRGTLVTI